MKKLLLLLSIFFAAVAHAVPNNVVFKIGSAGRVTIDDQDYERGYITYRWYLSGSDTLIELARQYNTSQPFKGAGRVVSYFKDGDNSNTAFASFAAWRTWWRANGEAKPDTIVSGGGGTPADPTASIQYNNAGAFGADADFFWDGTSENIRTNGIATTATPGVIFQNTTVATAGVPNQYPPHLKFLGSTYNNTTGVVTGWRLNPTSTRQTTNIRPALSIDATRDGSTWEQILSFTPFASTPITSLIVGSFSLPSGGNLNIPSGVLNLQGSSTLQLGQTTVGALPSAVSSFGKVTTVTDANSNGWGDVATGGGSFLVMVWSNGTNWTIIGK